MTQLHAAIQEVTERIKAKSADGRRDYLERMQAARMQKPQRTHLSCGNLAHGFAACDANHKQALAAESAPNIGIVSAYNDMLSAHQPYADFPPIIKQAADEVGAVAQFAGGTPAMCDGVTQGQPGMELSLFSRDVIALSTAVALTHGMFDAALCLGICDKIVPGLFMGALAFGHLPVIFVPGGPMPSGLPNAEKSRIRQLYAEGKVGRAELLRAESESYHAPGTCTFYGTANSNQMMMEAMGLHLPGAAFVNPNTPLRTALTRAATQRAAEITAQGNDYRPMGEVVDERAIVNAIATLVATGGSTNHTIHLVAMASIAGIRIDWTDIADISRATPLLARVYPNGQADVNHFQAAGGTGFVIGQLLAAGGLHGDVETVIGKGLSAYAREPWLSEGRLDWRDAPAESGDRDVLRPANDPFDSEGGIRLLTGNLGRSIIKVSAVNPQHRVVRAPAAVFDDQDHVLAAFKEGKLHRDAIVVVRGQGPRANGMPELHKLTPALGVLQDLGFKVALVTDGRMSGASGKVPAAIHVSPEAASEGPIGRLREGDIVSLDSEKMTLTAEVPVAEWNARPQWRPDPRKSAFGFGRELFASMRGTATTPEQGAITLLGAA
ncbi:phosphogluconate dehydratase [Dongia deserti]|uniref:phosphogluconate dehydratase n=1 Tax=Dongia deserti TaxID=2268030 RepID=UPI000E6543EC|nr:phosphogluconate dehydratase [Dongia deserti]